MAERPNKPVWVAGWHPLDQNINNDAIWNAIELFFPSVPTITTDLESEISPQLNATVEFEIACAEPERGTLSYQWQYKGEDDEDFDDIASETSATYTISTWSADDEGSYRCQIINTYGNITSTKYSAVCVATTGE